MSTPVSLGRLPDGSVRRQDGMQAAGPRRSYENDERRLEDTQQVNVVLTAGVSHEH
jgi:hypothetical protein